MRIGNAFAALALVSAFAYAVPAAPAQDGKCEFQNDSCSVPPAEWPNSSFRMGLTVMEEANAGSIYDLSSRNRRTQGVSTNFSTDFGAEFSYAFKVVPWLRFAFLFVPFSVDARTPWPTGKDGTHVYRHGTAFLELQIKGLCLTAGMAEYKLGGSLHGGLGNWDNTSIGLGIVLARMPGWGGKNFFPEWRK